MPFWRHVTRGLRVLTDGDAADPDIADQVDHSLDEANADLMARRLSPAEARRRARLTYGDRSAVGVPKPARTWSRRCEPTCATRCVGCGAGRSSRR